MYVFSPGALGAVGSLGGFYRAELSLLSNVCI